MPYRCKDVSYAPCGYAAYCVTLKTFICKANEMCLSRSKIPVRNKKCNDCDERFECWTKR